jgi:uncharacterized protein HemX
MEAGTPPTPPPATGPQPVVVRETPEQQIDGLRAWVAQIDRRLGVRSIAGAVAIVLALAAGIVGVVLARDAKDHSATKAEVASLRDQVSASTKEASQATQDTIAELRDSIDALDSRVATIASGQRTSDSELEVAKSDIDELRGQISDLENQVNSLGSSGQNLGNGGN